MLPVYNVPSLPFLTGGFNASRFMDMTGIFAIVSVLVVAGLLVWWLLRLSKIPPNARLLFDLLESLGRESDTAWRKDADGQEHSEKKEGQEFK